MRRVSRAQKLLHALLSHEHPLGFMVSLVNGQLPASPLAVELVNLVSKLLLVVCTLLSV